MVCRLESAFEKKKKKEKKNKTKDPKNSALHLHRAKA